MMVVIFLGNNSYNYSVMLAYFTGYVGGKLICIGICTLEYRPFVDTQCNMICQITKLVFGKTFLIGYYESMVCIIFTVGIWMGNTGME